MSGSTCSKKAAANNTEPKPLSNKEVYYLLNSLRSEVSSLKSARNSDAAEMQSLRLALSSPPALSSYHQQSCAVLPAYDWFIQEPYRAANRTAPISPNGLRASTECFALPSTQTSRLTTFPRYLKTALPKKTE
ncbi:hypothetical protein O181_103481 [Austropuccinia psidii MF-1]|uniref:Uncharacterized protein n=1 Tax=Austropuccinia psidii MF-1 TaxID=1389203 RepID=A0A9Q3PKJ6_9BASI|nr:hypothetical protein [Austropuccinia psidii MF-1]